MNSFKKHLKFNLKFGVNPDDDWKIIFVVTATLIFLVSILNVYMFIKVGRGEFFAVEEETEKVEMLDINTLRDTVFYYRNKAANFENILNGEVPALADPSI